MKLRSDYTCPLELVHDMIKGKWKTIIIFQLREGGCSLSELERTIEGITQKMLLEQLRELIEADLIVKETFDGYPLRVLYHLTDKGMKMLGAVQIMQEIGVDIMVEYGLTKILDQKGIPYTPRIPTKK